MKSVFRKEHLPFVIMLALALALRLINTTSIGENYYANFLSDASTYKLWASKITAGTSYGGPAFPMGPLYPYFLAMCLNMGFSFYSVLFLQAIFGTIVVFNIYKIANKIFGRQSGLIAGFLAAVYGPFVFYDGLLLSESLQLLLISSALLLIIPHKGKKHKPIYYFAGSLLIGLAALGRATILIFPLLIVMYWTYSWFREKNKKSKFFISRSLLMIAGIISGILPSFLHNMSNGELVPVSSNFGINFYIGNNSASDGSYNEPAGLNLSSDFTGRQVAERETGRELTSAGVSNFWLNRAMDYITDNPGRFLAGLLNKAWLYFWNFDIPQAESIQIHHEFSPIFSFLPAGYWFVLIPGLLGIILSDKNNSQWILFLLLISSVLGVMIFFVIGRFKLIGSIALLIFAGNGIYRSYHWLKEKDWRKIKRISFIAFLTIFILFLPRSIDRNYKTASAYDNVGISYYFKKQPEEAIRWYRKASRIKSGHTGVLNNIGGYYYTMQMPDSAVYYFHLAIDSDSTDDRPYQNLGRVFLNSGKIDSSYYYYKKAKALSPFGVDVDRALNELESLMSDGSSKGSVDDSFDALFSRAERLASMRDYQNAEIYYRKALELRPDEIRALNNLGFSYQAQGKLDEAIEMFEKVIDVSGGSAVAYNNLASVYYRKGMLDSAETIWEKAQKLEPTNPQIKKNLEYLRKSRGR